MSAWGKAAESCDALLKRVEQNDSTLTDLIILPSKTWGDDELNRLSVALRAKQNTYLQSLSASGHDISPEALRVFGSAISDSALINLAIGGRSMGDEGVVAFCLGLDEASSTGGHLQCLDLEFKGLSKAAMKALGTTFGASAHLKKLNLARNENVGDDGLVELCTSATASAEQQRQKQQLSSTFSQLEKLDLSECNIGPVGAAALAQCIKGEDSNVGDIRTNRISLLLNNNSLGSLGIQNLSSAICGQSVLSSLLLQNCDIGDEGVLLLTQAVTLSNSTGLSILDLSKNGISAVGSTALADTLWNTENEVAWKTLSDIRLAGNPLGEDGIKNLTGSLRQRDSAGGNTIVKLLDLCQTGGGNEGAAAALRCGNLTSLRVFNNKLGSEGFQQLRPLLRGGHPSLESLDLGGNDAGEDAVVGLLEALAIIDETLDSNLRVLEIGGNSGGYAVEDAVQKLKEVRPNLDVARDRPRKDPNA